MNTQEREPREIATRSTGAVILGVLLIILGIIAIAEPVFASVVIDLFLGWLFVIGGIIQFIYAFKSRHTGAAVLKILVSLLAIAVGAFLVLNPLRGVLSLTLIVGIYFFIDGALRVITAFQIKPRARWGWMLLSGILNIILGILIWSQWPFEAAWIIGLLVGISLVVNGTAAILLGTVPQAAAR
ncbi:DUF308 domain-containing protein [Romeria aff. gracilis LEGE 07310]|uniref:DUF308 domain-containing protein n=1 Tax=Vasconcelosia minhoensis LEGE 07310 TaxID=915328 RepID=A0A8J7AUH1_9CYAN|nr:DUF308 domain-containing protein [Romeria gracilis]MBE9075732.1 DUF308 domain-containing protein [Romeria aff. gracilis LEGE 07310]